MEKKAGTVVKFDSEGLKEEAKVQGQRLANHCMFGLKLVAGNLAKSATYKIFEYLTDRMNAKLSA